VNFPLISNGVMDVDEFLSALDAGGTGTVRVQPGDSVRGSDHGEIGEVEEVVPATDEHEGYLRVPRGMIFEKDTYVPLDAVVRRSGATVFINVPKLVVGSMPWNEPPTASAPRLAAGMGVHMGDRSARIRSRRPAGRDVWIGAGSFTLLIRLGAVPSR
jgi:ureidoacrylate peracid hydrolase